MATTPSTLGGPHFLETPTHKDAGRSTARTSSVWGSERRLQHDAGTPYTRRGSPVNSLDGCVAPSLSDAGGRREAAAWVETITCVRVNEGDDAVFTSQLADGVLLCTLINAVIPGVVKKVHEKQTGTVAQIKAQRFDNVQAFLSALASLAPPPSATFDHEDLSAECCDDGGAERVVECILWLKGLHERRTSGDIGSPTNDVSPQIDIARKSSLGANYGTAYTTPLLRKSSLGNTPVMYSHLPSGGGAMPALPPTVPLGSAMSGRMSGQSTPGNYSLSGVSHAGSMGGASSRGGANAGVSQMLNHWSTVMRQHTGQDSGGGSAGGESSESDNMGGVFRTALNSLTADYERKLSAKDAEVNRARESVGEMQAQMSEVQQQLAAVRTQLETHRDGQATAARASREARSAEAERERLSASLQASEARCGELASTLHGYGEAGAQQVAELQAEVAELAGRLTVYEAMEGRYRSVAEENQRLYNLVQELKGSIRIFCRVRPSGATGESSEPCLEPGEGGELALHDPSGQVDVRVFRFDKVFDCASSQAEVYRDTQGLIRSVLDGYNVCIFAYGQTGSGKTHTMSGTDVENEDGRGINYRALGDLFSIVKDREGEMEYSIRCQMIEIYNESLRDLFTRDVRSGPKLELRNTMPSGQNVVGVEQVEVAGPHEVMALMERGSRNRAVAGTQMNERSSRSHQVLTIIVDGLNRVTGATTHACLHLVDLAGSERLKQSGAAGDRLVETCNINASLSALGDVMAALARKDAHVPYRNSKLTQMLQDSLGGSAKVMMFMHVAPEGSFSGETLSTLNFGTKVAAVSLGQAKRNVDNSRAFANEEVARARREAERGEEAAQAALRRCAEEKRAREALEREVAKLKAQLTSAQRGTAYTAAPEPSADASIRSFATARAGGTYDGGGTPSSRLTTRPLRPLDVGTARTPTSGLGLPPLSPMAGDGPAMRTPASARGPATGLHRSASSGLPAGHAVPPLVPRTASMSDASSAHKTPRPVAPAAAAPLLPRPSTASASRRDSLDGSLMAAAAASRPSTAAGGSATTRAGGTYAALGSVRASTSAVAVGAPTTRAQVNSLRAALGGASASSAAAPSGSLTSRVQSASNAVRQTTATATASRAAPAAGPAAVPQSAGGRRMSTGGSWK
ncbi:hypothetical protein FOA52_005834 [Chlamydomonas sp. UWO 241]|nr:hypothetical protein FOA52_005834 [Chlamydomonas sp. UWO 241]